MFEKMATSLLSVFGEESGTKCQGVRGAKIAFFLQLGNEF